MEANSQTNPQMKITVQFEPRKIVLTFEYCTAKDALEMAAKIREMNSDIFEVLKNDPASQIQNVNGSSKFRVESITNDEGLTIQIPSVETKESPR